MSIKNTNSSDGLAEFRKNLHTMLHQNDQPNINQRRERRNISIQPQPVPVLKHQHVESKRVFELELKVKELEKIINSKNTKILNLSKTNLSKTETIKNLNDEVSKLSRLNKKKDSQIDQLEKIILKMQLLSQQTQQSKEEEEEIVDSDNSFNDDSIRFDFTTNEEFITKLLLNSNNTLDFDKDLNLNTQQLMDLDLNKLALKNTGPSIYNSNKIQDPYIDDDGNNSDIGDYLFSV